ncbi:acyltransferase [Micrococcus endophyticus]|uniref:acyltransferase n=1 Tax=Micrococcus endophyticus TaxID=455343 RepID=UPI002003E84F|nr:hypothetical protein [Micrococcus endophyticus]MCK6091078.1 hypothetical protein [Micrococcus endophyticus]
MKRLPTLPPKVRARVRAAENRLRSRATGAHVHPTAWVMRSAWIERGATVGAHSFVNRGVEVAAGAVVTRSTEPNGLYAGVPARRVKDLD